MSRRQATVIISVLAVVAVILALLLAYLLGSGAGGDPDTAADTTTSSSTPSTTTGTPPDETSETTVVQSPDPSTVTVPPAPPVQSPPTFVRCVTGLASMGIYSDGSTRPDTRCPEPRVREAEGVCGGMDGWKRVSRERYIDLCGKEPPTGG